MKILIKGLILILLTASESDLIAANNKPIIKITLENIFKERLFYQESILNLHSTNDGKNYTVLEDYNSIVKYSYSTGEKINTLFAIKERINADIPYIYKYEISSDETKIIFSTNIKPLYRNSYYADYYVFDLINDSLFKINKAKKIRNASFSPVGNKVAYIYDNNIYIYDLKYKTEKQITIDGKQNKIINGVPDWVYEEEFCFTQAYQWSFDGNNIAYYKFNESRVKDYTITEYTDTYPEYYKYKYPKAGEKNSIVSIYIYNSVNNTSILVDIGKETDQYIPRIKWAEGTNKLAVVRLNRLQNHVEVLLANIQDGNSKKIYDEKNKYFISEINDSYINFIDNGKGFVIISEQSGYKHLYHYNITGKILNQITVGNYDIDKLIGIDKKTKTIYYTSHKESPLQTNVYKISIYGYGEKRLSLNDGTNTAEFSKDYNYYKLSFNS